ncbi:agrin-like isoform X1 [Centruroides sculpturatus]|uniref:agrin-like isoform X1 n=1 Tax=Centruroides sculpturatus TaxID=218467 RepID=UPI000C6CFA0C|nr:agrin-like isoform X1 [Centruroides sculpturatus]XP_023225303.1 agrin-like isoform X1 [Centruroides sculpturatus]
MALKIEYGEEKDECVQPVETTTRRRRRSVYLLLTLLVLGVLVLVFLLVTGTVVYLQYAPQKSRPPVRENTCESMYCAYGAQCLLDERTQQAYCRCQDTCSDVFAPVCGTDDVTYSSECQLRTASCTQQKRIFVRHQGPCDMKDPCEDKKCNFGAQCRPSLDGRTAECVCPEKCASYGDNRGSRPVCGTDGKDYGNVCELRRTACREMREVEVKFQGRCDPCEGVECPAFQDCQLDENRNPICRCNAICTTDIRPVCASDGKTYTNECTLRVEACKSRRNLRIIYSGECNKGVNPCDSLRCSPGQQCHIDHYGIATCQCPSPCEPAMRPVCGNDGLTYDSECELIRRACLEQKNISMAYRGACGEAGPCNSHRCDFGAICVEKGREPSCECPTCSEEFRPICGSDGISYTNECKLKREACDQRKIIQVAYRGLCSGCENKHCEYYALCESGGKGESRCVCPQSCVTLESPVCGTDGVTYPNECEMRIAACKKQQYVMVASRGRCDLCQNVHCKYGARCENGRCVCPTECPDTHEPICANDGVTYQNECEMWQAACQQSQDLSILFYGECEDVGGSGLDLGSGMSTCEKTCQYGGMCDYDADGVPRCVCNFQCPTIRDPVCGSDGKLYDNDCKMREESCRLQQSLQTANLEKCGDVKLLPCDGESPLRDPVSDEEYYCGEGPKSQTCPPDSFCHRSAIFAICCREVAMIKNCEETMYGCCPDGKTSAQGLNHAGCPNVCNCNKLGSYEQTCDPVSKQCPCKPGVGGLRCDRCEPGYWGLHKIAEGNSGCTQSVARPVSGSCDQLKCSHEAICREKKGRAQCVCDIKCTSEESPNPVCGSDGVTYGSECQMRLFSCRYQKAITVLSYVPCKADDVIIKRSIVEMSKSKKWQSYSLPDN